ncbi:MAG: lyase [Deltaproteobacteria bacterium]|nr:lyase [Deltaproteobacteria bacterium]
MGQKEVRLGWGHINVNVSDLDAAIIFYEKLGFSVLLPGIPYLALSQEAPKQPLSESSAAALGLETPVAGRACIMQLGKGFPMLDLTELLGPAGSVPLTTRDRGIVRICLASQNLDQDYARLTNDGVEFLSSPQLGEGGSAKIAVCRDPDGTLIELIEIDLDRWSELVG